MDPKKNPNYQKINIDQLLAKSDKISNAAIRSAISKVEEEKQKLQEQKLLERIGEIQGHTAHKLRYLRNIREAEKRAKKELQVYAAAEQLFYETADFDQYKEYIVKNL